MLASCLNVSAASVSKPSESTSISRVVRGILTIATVPELRIYSIFEGPIGPHPIAMFEVNLLSPAEFGAFIPWLSVWRGPLSALVHPNTVVAEGTSKAERAVEMRKDHTTRALWMGPEVPLDASVFERMASS